MDIERMDIMEEYFKACQINLTNDSYHQDNVERKRRQNKDEDQQSLLEKQPTEFKH